MPDIMASSLSCGINIADWENLELGQVIDVIITKINAGSDEDKEIGRVATQSDWDRFSS